MRKNSLSLSRLALVGLALAGLIVGCDTDETLLEAAVETPTTQAPDDPMFRAIDGATVLGAKLTNPYSLSVSRAAYDSLSQTLGFDGEGVTVTATDLYVRFEPQNLDDIQRLSKDSTLLLFDAPLDYEIAVPGAGYRDPSLGDGQPGYLYTAVKLSYPLQAVGVSYTVLDSLFQPESEGDTHLIGNGKGYRQLERAAHVMVGLDPGPAVVKGQSHKDYIPTATIRFRDDNGFLTGLEGANVHFSYFTRTGQGFTNAVGFVASDKGFNYRVNCKLVWERYNFAIKDGVMNRAVIDGPKTDQPWILNITNATNPNDRDWRRAMVHRGAYRYYYQDILGLRRPPENGIFSFQLHYRVRDEVIDGAALHDPGTQWLGLGSQINIGLLPPGFNNAAGHYAVAIHETGHAVHWDQNRSGYPSVVGDVRESYAIGIEHFLTRIQYPAYTRLAAFLPRRIDNGFHHGLAVDLVDAADGFTLNGACCEDFVSGYSPLDVQESTFGTSTWAQWEAALRDRFVNPTEGGLAALFAYW